MLAFSRGASILSSRNLSTSARRFASTARIQKKEASSFKWFRRLGVFAAVGFTAYEIDKFFNASSVTRTLRCVYVLGTVGLDYKYNYGEGQDIEAMHEKNAEKLYNMLLKNKGLYIKMGQAVAIQAQVFPEPYKRRFAMLYDAAPQDSWDSAAEVFKSAIGQNPDDVFAHIDHAAVASASIAQVHKAVLKSGETVAVKIQHPDINKQVAYDLAAYRWAMYCYEKFLFHLPIYFIAEHVSERIQQEVDFRCEAKNTLFARSWALESSEDIYVPKVYEKFSSDRVMVSEWIDGTPLTNVKEIKKKFNSTKALYTITNVFAKQIFEYGGVHCDPHPGNILLRKINGRQQVVLIDHGLYIYETPKFRKEYCTLWRSMLSLDSASLFEIAKAWGIGDSEMFASSVMMSKYKDKKGVDDEWNEELKNASRSRDLTEEEKKKEFERQEEMKERFKNFIKDTTKIPLELIFLGRAIRILQGLNREFGSPVNRVKIFGIEASKALTVHEPTWSGWFRQWRKHLVFRIVLLASDVSFLWLRITQFFGSTKGLEDVIDAQFQKAGVEASPSEDMFDKESE